MVLLMLELLLVLEFLMLKLLLVLKFLWLELLLLLLLILMLLVLFVGPFKTASSGASNSSLLLLIPALVAGSLDEEDCHANQYNAKRNADVERNLLGNGKPGVSTHTWTTTINSAVRVVAAL